MVRVEHLHLRDATLEARRRATHHAVPLQLALLHEALEHGGAVPLPQELGGRESSAARVGRYVSGGARGRGAQEAVDVEAPLTHGGAGGREEEHEGAVGAEEVHEKAEEGLRDHVVRGRHLYSEE